MMREVARAGSITDEASAPMTKTSKSAFQRHGVRVRDLRREATSLLIQLTVRSPEVQLARDCTRARQADATECYGVRSLFVAGTRGASDSTNALWRGRVRVKYPGCYSSNQATPLRVRHRLETVVRAQLSIDVVQVISQRLR